MTAMRSEAYQPLPMQPARAADGSPAQQFLPLATDAEGCRGSAEELPNRTMLPSDEGDDELHEEPRPWSGATRRWGVRCYSGSILAATVCVTLLVWNGPLLRAIGTTTSNSIGAQTSLDELVGRCSNDPRSKCRLGSFMCGKNSECDEHSNCRCKDGFCARVATGWMDVQGAACEPPSCAADTGGTCEFQPCMWNRGPTYCILGKCMCRLGYCSSQGHCSLGASTTGNGTVLAKVVPVNDDHRAFPEEHGSIKTALCISGGGIRSLTLATGAVRALEHLGVMQNIDAISGVSGGAWFSAVYMFSNLSTEELLGNRTDPKQLTMDKLESAPPYLLGKVATTSSLSFVKDLHQSALKTPPDELWMEYIYDTILKPAGLCESHGSMMAATEEDVQRIKAENPLLKDVKFMVPDKQDKILVIGGTLLAPKGYDSSGTTAVSLQISPDYIGSPFHPNSHRVSYDPVVGSGSTPKGKHCVGGGFVESFAFGGEEPSRLDSRSTAQVKHVPMPRHAFSLLKALTVSSAAFGSMLADYAGAEIVVPTAKIWPVLSKSEEKADASKYKLGDGGNSENAGLLVMLQRGASKVIWLINTDVPLGDKDYCNESITTSKDWPNDQMTNQLYDKFGFGTDSSGGYLSHNKVFAREDLATVACSLQKKKKSKKPVVHLQKHKIESNEWWGIQGGTTVEVLYVYNDRCEEFELLLPPETQKELPKHSTESQAKDAVQTDLDLDNLTFTNVNNFLDSTSKLVRDKIFGGRFNKFPNYETILQNKPEFTSITPEQANLLAAFAEYSIMQNEKSVKDLLGV